MGERVEERRGERRMIRERKGEGDKDSGKRVRE
jgi:hypothetical protein